MIREEHEAFFGKMLSDVDETTAPYGLTDVRGDGHVTVMLREVEEDLGTRLRQRARALGVSAASVFHVAWGQVLARVCGREDVVFGTVLSGRTQGVVGADRALGMFLNTLPVRLRMGEDGVRDSIRKTHLQLAELLRHENASLALAQRCSRVAAPAPLFTSLLNYRHGAAAVEEPSEALDDWDGIEFIGAEQRTNYPLTISVNDVPERGFLLSAQAQSPIEPGRVCDLMHTALEVLVSALERTPAKAVRQLDVLPDAERVLLRQWNATGTEYPNDKCIQTLFEEQAARRPEAVAVVYEERQLTYGELNAQANRLAHELRRMGVGAGERVGIVLARSIELVVAEVAILKCGAAYVPLDENAPAQRKAFMLEDCGAKVVVTGRGVDLPAGTEVRRIDIEEVLAGDGAVRNLETDVDAGAAAYVMYTSGSTGQPKGVEVAHRSVVRLLFNNRYAEFGEKDRVAFVANPAFDASTMDVWAPLLRGGCMVVIDRATVLEPRRLARTLEEQKVDILSLTTGVFNGYAEELGSVFKKLRYLIIGGDVVDKGVLERVWKESRPQHFVNTYGPTESTLFATAYEVNEETKGGKSVPIGKPIGNTRVYVLDQKGEQAPQGAVGELYIGGAGVARGYVNRADLTAERFVPDPYAAVAGARMYRTGDVGRYRADGNIEFVGRNDNQVKIRGFRIELGEIEARLSEHPMVREVAVVAREEAGDKQLVAYYTEKGESVHADGLRAHLSALLPEYMVPAAYVRMDVLPLTANGKLDRKALPAPDAGAVVRRGYEAPQGEVERTLAGLWSELLHVERVGRHDNFFELGGHSLLVVSLIERIRRAGLHAHVSVIFAAPTLSALAAIVGGVSESGIVEVPANGIPAEGADTITPEMLPLVSLSAEEIAQVVGKVPGGARNVQDIYPLTPLQEGILFHHLLAKEGDPYVLNTLLSFESRERLDGYLTALQAVIDRHDILRTSVEWEGLAKPVQVVWRNAPLSVEEIAVNGEAGDVAAELRRPFDSRHYRLDLHQAPLIRMCVAEDKANGRWLALRLSHHLVDDHTSVEAMQAEIQAHLLGQSEELSPPVPLRNFVAQAQLGVKQEEHEAYFRKMLSDVEEPTAPFGITDVQGNGQGATRVLREVEASIGDGLRQCARALGVSAASLFHVAWGQVLARVCGREDVVFGTVLFGRMQGVEGAGQALGLFINTLPVRLRIGEESAKDSVLKMHTMLAELLRHEHAPLALAQRCSGVAAPAPLFTSLFNYRHNAETETDAASAAVDAWEGIRFLSSEERSNYPLTLSVDDLGERGFVLNAQAQAPIEPSRVCELMHAALEGLVSALQRTPTRALRQLEVLPAADRALLAQWNATDEAYPNDQCIQTLFEEQAAKRPGAVAVVYEERQLTYGELNAQANRLAHHLRRLGVGPDTRVGICLERSLEMVVGILAILKAGGAYVPLDPEYPTERLAYMLSDSAPTLVLTHGAVAEAVQEVLRAQSRLVVDVLADADRWAKESDANPGRGSASDLAYVIYTSGSTGKPKGVLIEHGNVTRLFAATAKWYQFDENDVWTLFHSFAFDFSVWEIWGALVYGGSLVVVPRMVARAPREFHELLCATKVTVLNQTPSAFQQLVAAQRESLLTHRLRYVIFGGEALEVATLRPWYADGRNQQTKLINMYGITETTVHVTYQPLQATDVERVGASPIGRPIDDLKTYILDANGQPAPIGVVGELYVGGAGVARGYVNRADLTAERFVPDPYVGEPGARMYRTGDLGKYQADGNIEYLGRNDNQVKIRGFRIELGEIEARLSEHPMVREVAVVAREESAGNKQLVAYYVEKGEGVNAEELRARLSALLPKYMVPAAYVRMDALPLTANGKLDRKALPAPDQGALVRRGYEAPNGEVEKTLAGLWCELLQVAQVGRQDNFFELGGHSLLVVSLIERMRRVGLHAKVSEVFTAPTLAALAAVVSGESGIVEVPANGIPVEGADAITPEMLPLVSLSAAEIAQVAGKVSGGARNVQDIYPLTPLQEGILFHHLLAQEGDPYVLSDLIQFDGRERLDGYLKALQAVVDRHDILRTAVDWEGLPEPVQVVWRKAPLCVEELKMDGEVGDVAAELRRRFDPRHYRLDLHQAPLIRMCVAEDKVNGRWLALQLSHHLVDDHTSVNRMQSEIQAHLLGQSEQLSPPVPLRNFVAQARRGVSQQEHEAYFRKMLSDVEETTAPFGLTDVQGDGQGITVAAREVEAGLGKRLRQQARALGVSAASVFHVAWGQVLARVCGREDVVFGTILFGRMHGGAGADRALGMFINTLPMRLRIGGDGARDSVAKTHALLAELLRHEHVPLALAQRCSGVAAPAPLFTSLLNYRHNSGGEATVDAHNAWEGIELIRGEQHTNYPLTLAVDDLGGQELILSAQAQAPIEPSRVCDLMHTALEVLVSALERAPTKALGQLDVLPAAERARLSQWNATDAEYPQYKCIQTLFEEQVDKAPEAVAVVYEERQLTYGELNAQANRLAHELRRMGVKAGERVGIVLARSIELVVAEVAILKCGAAYVPLDENAPAQRKAFMLEDCGAKVVVTGRGVDLPAGTEVRRIDIEEVLAGDGAVRNLETDVDAGAAAYVMYTSGSTGQPKGVEVAHRSVVRLLFNNRYAEFTENDRVAFVANPAFDASTMDVWAPLLRGGRMVVIDRATVLEPKRLARTLEEQGVDVLSLTTGVFNRYAAELGSVFRRLRYLIIGGDVVDKGVLERVWKESRPKHFVNTYGPTESTLFATAYEVGEETKGGKSVPIGKPIGNTRVYVLDQNGGPAPQGAVGELYIGGAGVARGYVNRAELTAERFLPDPYAGEAGARMYRTGDLGRYRGDGNIEFVGRNDHQVKIRGFRIELGEIEARLSEHPMMREVAVVAREEAGDKQLVAYYTEKGERVHAEGLRAHLSALLPEYMVPAAYVRMDVLPLTANGKLDRRALPAPGGKIDTGEEHVAPCGEAELMIAQAWKKILGLQRVSVLDNFFALGGHSLKAVALVAELQKHFEANVNDIFRHQTVRALAQNLKARRDSLSMRFAELKKRLVFIPTETHEPPELEAALAEYRERSKRYDRLDLAKPRLFRRVLVTGATGYLGAHLLHEIVGATDAEVVTVVRAESNAAAQKRLGETLGYYFGEDYLARRGARIRVLHGDVAAPKLGLDGQSWEELSYTLDGIVHAAAQVKHYGHRDEFERANVLATRQLLHLAETGSRKSFHHLSTLSVADGRVLDRRHILFSEDDLDVGQRSDNHYVATKLQAELAVAEAQSRGLMAHIYRVGNISVHSRTGLLQKNIRENAFFRRVRALVNLGVSAELPGDEADVGFVDSLARAVVLLMRSGGLGSDTFHVTSPHFVHLSQLLASPELALKMRLLPVEEFVDYLHANYDDLELKEHVNTYLLHSGWMHLLSGSEDEDGTRRLIVAERTHQICERLGFTWPEVDARVFGPMVERARSGAE